MDQLLTENPRTCIINLENNYKNLGFNLTTKKRKFFAHSIVKLNSNLAAAKSGIQENDILLMVNDQDCCKLKHQQVVNLLMKKNDSLKLFVCQPADFKLNITKENDSNLISEEEDLINNINENQRTYHKYQQPSYEKYDIPVLQNSTEQFVDENNMPIKLSNHSFPYIDYDEDLSKNKENKIKKNLVQPILTDFNKQDVYNQVDFKRNYKLKQHPLLVKENHKSNDSFLDHLEDENLSLSTTGVSNFDEQYNELRNEIFNHTLNKKSSKTDKYNFESQDIEFNEYVDVNSHKIEKSETKVEITNDEYQNKKVTTKLVEKIFKSFDDLPMKNILSKKKSTNALLNEAKTKPINLLDVNYPINQNLNTYKPSYLGNTQNASDNSLVKEPFIERKIIQPKQVEFVQIQNNEEVPNNLKSSLVDNQTKPLVISQTKITIDEDDKHEQQQLPENNIIKNALPNHLPSPRLCKLNLPKTGNTSFGFTVKTNRKTNEKNIIEIIPNSIAQRAGLRLNDIIIEVNGINVTTDNHKQVTDYIKNSKGKIDLLVVSEPEMNVYKKFQTIPTSKQSNVIQVDYDDEIGMLIHNDQISEDDCIKGCGNFFTNLSSKQYRSYLLSQRKKSEVKRNGPEFHEKIKKFEKM